MPDKQGIQDASNIRPDERTGTLLVLGGSFGQLPLAKVAKGEGYRVVLVDNRRECPGAQVGDVHYCVSYLDKAEVLRVAQKEKVSGVFSNSEAAVDGVASVALELGLAGNTPEAVGTLQQKSSFRDAQHGAGVFAPRSIRVEARRTEVGAALEGMREPVIVKPVDSSASRGVTLLAQADAASVLAAVERAVGYSACNLAVIEEYVPMSSLTTIEGEAFLWEGECVWECVFSTARSAALPLVPMTYVFPALIDGGERGVVLEDLGTVFGQCGVTHGEFNFEAYFAAPGGLFIVEINARQGGNGIPRFVQLATGVDLSRLCVTTAMRDTGYLDSVLAGEVSRQRFATLHAVFPRSEGYYEGFEMPDDLARYLVGRDELVLRGAQVQTACTGGDCVALLFFEFDTREEQLLHSLDMERFVRCKVAPVGESGSMRVYVADMDFPLPSMFELLFNADGDFEPSLSEQVARQEMTLLDYAEKLCSKATVSYCMIDGELAGAVIGFTHDCPNDSSYITQVVVFEPYRNRGICGMLVRRYLDECRRAGLRSVWLTVAESNAAARRAYEREGFAAVGAPDDRGFMCYERLL